jgi:hypothetical protein
MGQCSGHKVPYEPCVIQQFLKLGYGSRSIVRLQVS